MESVGLNVDHRGLNKFATRNDGNYQIFLKKLHYDIERHINQIPQKFISIPYRRTSIYTERSRLSSQIQEKLRIQREGGSVPSALIIHGTAGSGKTQLVLNYIEQSTYDTILWIDARSKEEVISSFNRCAADLHINPALTQATVTSLTDSPSVRAVLKWLEQTPWTRWLVVFDGANDFTFGLREALPRGANGTVLVTSRDKRSRELLQGHCEMLRVDQMQPLEAQALLLEHIFADVEVLPQQIHQCLDVAETIGFSVLAIELAALYVNNAPDPKSSLADYPRLFARRKKMLLKNRDCTACWFLNKGIHIMKNFIF